MVASLKSVFPNLNNYTYMPELKSLITERTLIDVIKGIAELRKIGIAHKDVHYAKVVLDTQGQIYIIDFGLSLFIPVETLERKKVCDKQYYNDNQQFTKFFKLYLNFFKDNNIQVENDWELIFSFLDWDNPNRETFGWVAEQIKKNYFKLNK